jgi:hypothetical protein
MAGWAAGEGEGAVLLLLSCASVRQRVREAVRVAVRLAKGEREGRLEAEGLPLAQLLALLLRLALGLGLAEAEREGEGLLLGHPDTVPKLLLSPGWGRGPMEAVRCRERVGVGEGQADTLPPLPSLPPPPPPLGVLVRLTVLLTVAFQALGVGLPPELPLGVPCAGEGVAWEGLGCAEALGCALAVVLRLALALAL